MRWFLQLILSQLISPGPTENQTQKHSPGSDHPHSQGLGSQGDQSSRVSRIENLSSLRKYLIEYFSCKVLKNINIFNTS